MSYPRPAGRCKCRRRRRPCSWRSPITRAITASAGRRSRRYASRRASQSRPSSPRSRRWNRPACWSPIAPRVASTSTRSSRPSTCSRRTNPSGSWTGPGAGRVREPDQTRPGAGRDPSGSRTLTIKNHHEPSRKNRLTSTCRPGLRRRTRKSSPTGWTSAERSGHRSPRPHCAAWARSCIAPLAIGYDVNAALTECVLRGWQGLNADWLQPNQHDPRAAPAAKPREADAGTHGLGGFEEWKPTGSWTKSRRGCRSSTCSRLDRTPAAELLAGTAQSWLEIITTGRVWDEARDAHRIREAFVTLGLTRESWPAPKHFIEALPPVRVGLIPIEKEFRPASPAVVAKARAELRFGAAPAPLPEDAAKAEREATGRSRGRVAPALRSRRKNGRMRA
jgi:hypothetical protein